MTYRERFLNTLNFKKVDDRLPMMEWAGWWNKTSDRWYSEGLPTDIDISGIKKYFKLDEERQFWINARSERGNELIKNKKYITDLKSYSEMKEFLYPSDAIEKIEEDLIEARRLQEKGEIVVWITLEGYFWFPRTLFGIENHLFAFYDQKELMHRINNDLTIYHQKIIEELCEIIEPDFMTFAEDMSYNLGPMLSKELYDEFNSPYYKQVIPYLKKHNIIPLIDSDGQVEKMIPWFIEAGIEGVLPLERQAGVDIVKIREKYPDFKMIGAFDKMVMNKGEEAIRAEFERLLPVMKSGGYIPSCDHQTPPAVSLKDYKIYVGLMREYCEKATIK